MVQGVLYCRDDKRRTNAVELCVVCQWEWKICGAGTSSIKVAISTDWYWTVWISHPLREFSKGQINACDFFFQIFSYIFFVLTVPLSFVHTVTLCLRVIISRWMAAAFCVLFWFICSLSLCIFSFCGCQQDIALFSNGTFQVGSSELFPHLSRLVLSAPIWGRTTSCVVRNTAALCHVTRPAAAVGKVWFLSDASVT